MKRYSVFVTAMLVMPSISLAAVSSVSSSATQGAARTTWNANDAELDSRLGTVEGGLASQSAFTTAFGWTPTTDVSGKADVSCFASESAFNACFDLTWATGSGGASYPAAGDIAYSTDGESWTSLTPGTGVVTLLTGSVDTAGGPASYSGVPQVAFSTGLSVSGSGPYTVSVTNPTVQEAFGAGWSGDSTGVMKSDLYTYLSGTPTLNLTNATGLPGAAVGNGYYVADDCTTISSPATGAICDEY